MKDALVEFKKECAIKISGPDGYLSKQDLEKSLKRVEHFLSTFNKKRLKSLEALSLDTQIKFLKIIGRLESFWKLAKKPNLKTRIKNINELISAIDAVLAFKSKLTPFGEKEFFSSFPKIEHGFSALEDMKHYLKISTQEDPPISSYKSLSDMGLLRSSTSNYLNEGPIWVDGHGVFDVISKKATTFSPWSSNWSKTR